MSAYHSTGSMRLNSYGNQNVTDRFYYIAISTGIYVVSISNGLYYNFEYIMNIFLDNGVQRYMLCVQNICFVSKIEK